LAAEVTLYCDGSLAEQLNGLGNELRFALITSSAAIEPLSDSADAQPTDLDGLEVKIAASAEQKCDRCWHHRADVGSNKEHPDLCGRCVENIDGDGEQRHYA